MAVDTRNVDKLAVVQRYANVPSKQVSRTYGGEFVGSCPLCRTGRDRFHVWPFRSDGGPDWWCRICNESGDIIKLIKLCEGVTFLEACDMLEVDPGSEYSHAEKAPASRTIIEPPCKQWQDGARLLVEKAETYLWKKAPFAIEYLMQRGFTEATIRDAHFGYVPLCNDGKWYSRPLAEWGLDLQDYPGKEVVKVSPGILIPWYGDECVIWKLQVRKFYRNVPVTEDPRYMEVLGSKPGLYNGSAIRSTLPIVLCEGVFDARSGMQACGNDLAVFAATGSTDGAQEPLLVAYINRASYTLTAFDVDANKAGNKGAAYWQKNLHHSFRLFPYAHDINQMLQEGKDIRHWLEDGIELYGAAQDAKQAVEDNETPMSDEPQQPPQEETEKEWESFFCAGCNRDLNKYDEDLEGEVQADDDGKCYCASCWKLCQAQAESSPVHTPVEEEFFANPTARRPTKERIPRWLVPGSDEWNKHIDFLSLGPASLREDMKKLGLRPQKTRTEALQEMYACRRSWYEQQGLAVPV